MMIEILFIVMLCVFVNVLSIRLSNAEMKLMNTRIELRTERIEHEHKLKVQQREHEREFAALPTSLQALMNMGYNVGYPERRGMDQ
jgi:predicted Holliday junction resolvase-like endonuclease